VGSIVGTLSATDTPGDTLTYALVDDAEGRFVVDAATGVVRTAAALDHEAGASFTLKVKVTDRAGLSSQNEVTVAVNDVNEAPVARNDVIAVNEDATSDNLWTQLLGNDGDPDRGDQLTISAVNGKATLGSLLFDPTTQTLRYVADNDAFDALAPGATAVDSFIYTVADRNGLTSSGTVNVSVTGIKDGVTLTGGNADDSLVGAAGEDRLSGSNGNDRLSGLDGHDRLEGGQGNDQLFGGRGNDLLFGGLGDDRLEGGAGRDGFVFGARAGNDVIRDFDVANDKLLLDDTAVRSVRVADWNGDGLTDLRLDLTAGGSVTLLGLSSLSGVQIGSLPSDMTQGSDNGLALRPVLSSDGWLF
jgi:VCBS repeat-containing protein